MVQSVACCQQFAGRGARRTALSIIMLEYYDGPTAGLMKCEMCSRVYKFAMVDWDDDQEIRVHALAPISPVAFQHIEQIKAKHDPKWWPTGPEIDDIVATAEAPTMVAAFSRRADTVFAARNLTESDVTFVQEWLLQTHLTTERDWFSFLGLPRDLGSETK